MNVLKGLFIVIINIIIIYRYISEKQVILSCIMPFFISLLIFFKNDINIYILIPFTELIFLINTENIHVFKTVNFILKLNNIKLLFKNIKIKDFLNFSNHATLGGTLELSKATNSSTSPFGTPQNTLVSYYTTAGSSSNSNGPGEREIINTVGNNPQFPINTESSNSQPSVNTGRYNTLPPPINTNTINRPIGSYDTIPPSRGYIYKPIGSYNTLPPPITSGNINRPIVSYNTQPPVITGSYNTEPPINPQVNNNQSNNAQATVNANNNIQANNNLDNNIQAPINANNNPQVNNNQSNNAQAPINADNNLQVANPILPIYERDNRTFRSVVEAGKRDGVLATKNDAVNLARENFRNQISNQEGFRDLQEFGDILRALQPKIEDLRDKLENRGHNITISDCAEVKHILSMSPYQKGLRIGTKGFYNPGPLEVGKTISHEFNESLFLRRSVSNDLRSILVDINIPINQ